MKFKRYCKDCDELYRPSGRNQKYCEKCLNKRSYKFGKTKLSKKRLPIQKARVFSKSANNYNCPMCNEKFKYKVNYANHLSKEHNQSWKKVEGVLSSNL